MLFNKRTTPDCSYCKRSQDLRDGSYLCSVNGVTKPSEGCKKFKYDPLKRKPVKGKALDSNAYDDADFSL